jgi:hypothetical protein
MGVMQLAQLAYPPGRMVPPKGANQEAQATLNRIAALPGEFFVLDNCVDLTPIGKETFANSVAAWDVFRGDHGEVSSGLQQSLNAAVAQHVFTGIIAAGALGPGFPYAGAPAQLAAEYAGPTTELVSPDEAIDLQSVVPPPMAPEVVHYARAPLRP